MGALNQKEMDHRKGEEVVVNPDGLRRFRRTHDETSAWDELSLEIFHRTDGGNSLWVELVSVTYLSANGKAEPEALRVRIEGTGSPQYRTYSNSGILSRSIDYGDADAYGIGMGTILPDPINFQATIAAVERQMGERNFSIPKLIE